MWRITSTIRNTPNLGSDSTFVCLNWTLLILQASVQVSLCVFYALGLVNREADTYKNYTNSMMYINIGCTCAAQIILSFIFSQMSDPIEIYEQTIKEGNQKEMKIERNEQLIYSWIDKSAESNKQLMGKATSPSTDYQKLSGDNKNKNMLSVNNDMESDHSKGSTHRTYEEAKVDSNVKREANVDKKQRQLLAMFFSFCEPQSY